MTPQFVAAGESEEEVLLTLMQAFYALERLTFERETAVRALRQLGGDPTLGRVYLVEVGGEAVGYVVLTFGFSLEFQGRDALVDELYIDEHARGSGLGSATLAWVESVCRAEGVRALHLEVDHANERGQRLYRRLGYRDHDRHLLTKWIE